MQAFFSPLRIGYFSVQSITYNCCFRGFFLGLMLRMGVFSCASSASRLRTGSQASPATLPEATAAWRPAAMLAADGASMAGGMSSFMSLRPGDDVAEMVVEPDEWWPPESGRLGGDGGDAGAVDAMLDDAVLAGVLRLARIGVRFRCAFIGELKQFQQTVKPHKSPQ